MNREIKPGYVRQDFNGLAELVDWLAVTPQNGRQPYNGWASADETGRHADKDWAFGLGFGGALDLVREGWANGAKEIEKLRDEQVGELASTWESVDAPDWQRDVVGEEFDLGAYLEGDPECFLDELETETQVPVIDVWFKCGGNCNVKGKQLFAQGVAMLAAIQKIEAKGIRVRLTAWFLAVKGYGDDKRFHATTVVIKRAEEALQLHSLAFAIAHPGFFRRLIFGCRERQGNVKQTQAFVSSNYGSTVSTPDSFPGLIPDGAVCIVPDINDSLELAYGKIVQTLERVSLAPAA